MKKKLLSILMCICVCIGFLTGCTLVHTDTSYKDTEVVMTVGDTEITRDELSNQFNGFYNQYYQYFMYYDADTMMDLFYNSVVSRTIILQEANKLLEESKQEGANKDKFRWVDDEYEQIWYDVFDSIDSQLDSIEKALRLQAGTKEDDLPEWLKKDDNDETAYLYKAYEPDVIEAIDYSDAKYTAAEEPEFADKLAELKTQAIYRYNVETDAEKPRDEKEIQEEADKVYRDLAFTRYIDNLMVSAKAAGEKYERNTVLEKEIKRLYKSFYESALYTKYQEYTESNGIVADGLLDSDKIVTKFIELTNKDIQGNSSEEAYVEVITSSSNESLVLYHNDGEYTYFTVQHILIKFDDETLETLKEHEGYDEDVDLIIRQEYEALRSELAGVNYANLSTSYRDEDGYTVKVTVGSGEDEKTVNDTVTAAEIIDLVKAISGTDRERALAFNKLAWTYSADTGSFTEKLSAKLGLTISSENDKHGSYVSDFADGARALYNNGSGKIGDWSEVLSDYGLHIMMLVDVYEGGALVDITESNGGNVVIRDYNAIASDLQSTYVSNMTEQTLYHYIYDMLKDELVGTNGTYFNNKRNKLVADYKADDKVEYAYKMTYDELLAAIGF